MSKVHKRQIVNPSWAANQSGRHSSYEVCYCSFAEDHHDSRSITTQSEDLVITPFGETNDMLRIADRERWNFSTSDYEYVLDWLQTAGLGGKPVPLAKKIIVAINKTQLAGVNQ